jgi:hypothetical protein
VTARERVRVACKLAEFPSIDRALQTGEISYSKIRAMLRVATSANEILLLEHARLMTGSQLEKLCRNYTLVQRHGQESSPRDDQQRRYVRRRDTEDGMVKIEAVLFLEEAELVWAMLNHAATKLAEQATPSAANAAEESAAVEQTIGKGDDSAESGETSLQKNATSGPRAIGLSAPTAPTDLLKVENSVEGPAHGFTVELGADERPRFRDPRGRFVEAVPPRPETAGLGWQRIRAANASLAIDTGTVACGWDGTPANYGMMVGHLLAADGIT